ncbi:MAG: hypothetical protein HY984_01145 [Candidatus Magasanikbacteria bacterium]|nr:hypothetical protein [Candidatus Magasanikbacteria bacterium]
MTTELIGHQPIVAYFERARQNGYLSHAYLLVGPAHVGKSTLVTKLLTGIFSLPASAAVRSHPDIFWLKQEVQEKTGKKKQHIDVEQLRDLRSVLSRRPFVGPVTAAVIDAAEKMNIQAANALLKTLEEPSPGTIIFLLTSDESALPTTIRSRCQLLYLHSVSTSEISAALVRRGAALLEADRLARLSCGLPGQAFIWLESPDEYERFHLAAEQFHDLFGEAFYKKRLATEPFFSGEDQVLTRAGLRDVFFIWQTLLRDWVWVQAGLAERRMYDLTEPKTWSLARGREIETAIREALRLLKTNVQPRFVLESVLLAMP